MRQITFLCRHALNSLENMSIQELAELQQMAKEDYAEAYAWLCKAEGEEKIPLSKSWDQALEYVRTNPIPFDNEHVHAVTHAQKHAKELDEGKISNERWNYLINSFGLAMHLSCQLFLEIQKYVNKQW